MSNPINPASAIQLCAEKRIFEAGDKVQVKSQTGSGFPVFTVGEIEQPRGESVIVVKVWYYNPVDGDIKVAVGPQSVFVKHIDGVTITHPRFAELAT